MLKYRGPQLLRAGVIGTVLALLIVLVGLAPQQLGTWAAAIRYQALFDDAGGLAAGNDVTVAGVPSGTVTDIRLSKTHALVTFSVKATITLGADTTAHIRTGTLLGQRILTLESRGAGALRPLDVIPVTRTFAPYSLTDAVDELTTNTAGTDTTEMSRSLDTLSDTIERVAPRLGPTFDGLTRVAQALEQRDTALRDLLAGGNDVTAVLAERSQQVGTLILDADDLVEVLSQRRWAIMELLSHTSAVARQVSALVQENEQELAPTLDRLNAVTEVLERNRDNIAKALPGLAKYQVTLGETVASGPYYSAYIPNLDLAQALQPFFDYAFGFRRGTDAGQPPDDAGPRAELPIPYNGIPEAPR